MEKNKDVLNDFNKYRDFIIELTITENKAFVDKTNQEKEHKRQVLQKNFIQRVQKDDWMDDIIFNDPEVLGTNSELLLSQEGLIRQYGAPMQGGSVHPSMVQGGGHHTMNLPPSLIGANTLMPGKAGMGLPPLAPSLGKVIDGAFSVGQAGRVKS